MTAAYPPWNHSVTGEPIPLHVGDPSPISLGHLGYAGQAGLNAFGDDVFNATRVAAPSRLGGCRTVRIHLPKRHGALSVAYGDKRGRERRTLRAEGLPR